jgi:hypothetical protein
MLSDLFRSAFVPFFVPAQSSSTALADPGSNAAIPSEPSVGVINNFMPLFRVAIRSVYGNPSLQPRHLQAIFSRFFSTIFSFDYINFLSSASSSMFNICADSIPLVGSRPIKQRPSVKKLCRFALAHCNLNMVSLFLQHFLNFFFHYFLLHVQRCMSKIGYLNNCSLCCPEIQNPNDLIGGIGCK